MQRYNRLLLAFPPFTTPALLEFAPIGICQLASYVRQELPDTALRILDYTNLHYSEQGFREELRRFEPDIVGISIITLNAPGGYLLAELVHKYLSPVPVIMGGVHALNQQAECFAHGADYLSSGDGEPLLREVLQYGFQPNVQGLVSQGPNGEVVHAPKRAQTLDIDSLPFPAYDLVDMQSYPRFPTWEIIGSRGCPYRCSFCTNHGMWDGKIRFRSPVRIVDEIEHLYTQCGVRAIQFQDDTINVPRQRGLDICNEIIKRGLNECMTFMGSLRVNTPLVSPLLFEKLHQAGFVYLGFGVESGSQKVLDIMHKDLTPGEVRAAVKMARRAHIKRVMGYVMIANWGEGVRDVLRTWWLVLTTNMETAFSVCTAFPGTEYRANLLGRGYITDSSDWEHFNITSVTSRTDKLSKRQIYALYAGSILLQLVVSILRHGQTNRTLYKLWLHGRDLLRHRRVQ
jgi:anaerobic magnesium-protoporphyrin IX monomethyl ester cyclase